MVSTTEPPFHSLKYYFGIHIFHGQEYPAAWVEDNGVVVGGHPTIKEGTKVEITFEDWSCLTLRELGEKYGMKEVPNATLDPDPESP